MRGPRAWSDCGFSLKRRTVFATSALLDVEYSTVVSVPHGFRPIESSEQPHARMCDARVWTECDRERRLNRGERIVDSYVVKMLECRTTVCAVGCKGPFPKCLA